MVFLVYYLICIDTSVKISFLFFFFQDVFKTKKEEFEKFSSNLEQQTEQQYHLLKRNIELDGKRRAADLKKIEDAM